MLQDSSTVSFCPSFSFYASASAYIVPDHDSVTFDVDFEFVAPKTTPLCGDDIFFSPTKPYDDDVAIPHDHLLGQWIIPSDSDDREDFPASSCYSLCSPLRSARKPSRPSKRWRLRDLLRRSHSDSEGKSKGKEKTTSYKASDVAHRKSYLPYRQDLIGLFAAIQRSRC